MNPIKLGPFLGMNNRLPRNKLSTKEGAYLADAVNVDVRSGGEVTTRSGFSRLLVANNAHSLWRNLYVDDTSLYAIEGSVDLPRKKALKVDMRRGVQVSYTDHAGVVHFTNGDDIWRIKGDVVEVAGVPLPPQDIIVTPAVGGALFAGIYQLTTCLVSASGERSGTTLPVQVTIPDGTKLLITGIPQVANHTTEIYMTPCNGTMFYRLAETTATSIEVAVHTEQGMVAHTHMKQRIPAGQIIRSHNGRLFVANGAMLYYTEPWSMLHNPARDYMPFPEPITMIEPCGNRGFFISADKTYWLLGDVNGSDSTLTPVLPYRAVPGTVASLPNSPNISWFSERGLVIGTPDGQANNVHDDVVAVKPAVAGTSVVREQDGMRQVINSMFDSRTTVMAAQTWMDAEVIHQNPL